MPYADLLMLKNNKILANAKSRLPFFYTIPILSWLVSLFNGKKKNKTKKTQQKLITAAEIFEQEDDETVSKTKKITKTESLAAAANEITKELIPEGSSLDRELDYLARQWNKMISKEALKNLTNGR